MPPSRSVKEIFSDAIDMAEAERSSFLDRECAGDADARARVEKLLRAYSAGSGFMSNPDAAASAPAGSPGQEVPGTRIGPYRLLQQIGEGGFGVVFLAEQQEPMVRRVALKVIKLGMDTRQVIARFEAERQALAMMEHPNIARVLDAGATERGRPYFVMELVRGEPITQYCDRNKLDTPGRLELFRQVCHAVQHAHQKGIIHRDLKPSNVLVTVADGRPIPKVIDFGIAKATMARLTEKTLFTEHRQLIGTPEYMSPEQAEMCGVDIDTRSDIYSLGVLLYELLTGTTPLDGARLRSAAWGELQRIIREEEPPRPSTRLSMMKESINAVAAHRDTEPARLARLVRGDLDWIVMKCLDKDRARRYETADGLATDIQRHTKNEPVTAGPPGASYRIRKFVRRNRAAVLVGLVIAATVVLGVIGTTGGMVWALGERRRAETARESESEQRRVAQENEAEARAEATRAKTVLALLNEMLQPSKLGPQDRSEALEPSPATGQESALGPFAERLDAFARAWGLGEQDIPAVEAEVRMILGQTLRQQGLHSAAAKQFERTVEIRRRLYGELDRSLGQALSKQVEAVSAGGDRRGAVGIARTALESARGQGRPDDAELAERLHLLGDAYCWAGDFDAAEGPAKEALAHRERVLGHRHVRVADSLSQLADIATRRRRWDEAEVYFRDSAALCRELKGELHGDTTAQEILLAEMRLAHGDYPGAAAAAGDAVERARRAMTLGAPPSEERRVLAERLRRQSAYLVQVPDRSHESEAASRESLDLRRGFAPADPEALVVGLCLLGNICWQLGRDAEAERLLREALSVARTQDLLRFEARIAEASSILCLILRDAGNDLAEAERLGRESLAISRKYHPTPFWTVWILEYDLATIRRRQGDEAEAHGLELHAAAMVPKARAYRSVGVALRCELVGRELMERGQHGVAEPVLAERERIFQDIGPEHWTRYDAMSALGECVAAQGRFVEAEPRLLESCARLQDDPAAPPERVTGARERIVRLYEVWHAAEPGKGYDAKAAEWRARLDTGR